MTKYAIFDICDQFISKYWIGFYQDGKVEHETYTKQGLYDFVRNNPGRYFYAKPNEKLEGIIRGTRLGNEEAIKQKLRLVGH